MASWLADAYKPLADAGVCFVVKEVMNEQREEQISAMREERAFRYIYSEGLGEQFEQLDFSLLVSTYQAGKLCTFRSRSGRIKMLPRTFKRAMGVAADRSRMAVATQHQIWFLSNEPVIAAKIEPRDTYDACYLPRRSHVTSNIDVHEIAWGGDELWLVNTLFSCLCTIDDQCSFMPRWRPPFVTQLSRHDRCHLNGLAMVDGAPAYVTLFAETDSPQGWREHKRDGGMVMHVGSNEVVARGLSMPHSPRVHDGRLWVLDSGNGTLVCVDPCDGRFDTVVRFDGYPRGLAFCGRFAFVGLSKIREKAIFGGVPVADETKERPCGVAVVDLRNGDIIGRLEFEHSVEEIFDVQILSGVRFPTVIGFEQDTIERAALIAPQPAESLVAAPGFEVPDKAAADAEINHGLRCLKQDELQRAAGHFRSAGRLAPDYARAHNNLGYVLLALEDVPGAIDSCQQSVRYDPNYHVARNNLGNALRANGELSRARTHYEVAVRLRPEYANAHYNLGVVLCELGEPEVAARHLRRALDLQPDLAVAWNRLADVQCRLGKFDDALASHDRAIAGAPGNARFQADLGLSLSKVHRLEGAAEAYRKALRMDPGNADFHSDLALALLMMGNYDSGWKEHEWRLELVRNEGVRLTPDGQQVPVAEMSRSTPRKAEFPQAQWRGESLRGRTLLIWAEQGIGDEFMFASMFADVVERTGRCVIECDHRSLALMSRSFPSAEFVRKTFPPQPRIQAGDIDFQCAMGSLGLWLRPDEASFARAQHAYLKADQRLTDQFRQRYNPAGDKTVVGVSWRTANKARARQRNADLDLWHQILGQPEARFVSLQYGDNAQALARIRDELGVDIYQDPEVDSIQDLDNFAAQVAAMDLIVSIDNSTVHLAGALGKPVWTLLPFSPDWRWMLGRKDTPWYPSMRLFRQPAFGDWESVFNELADEFDSLTGDRAIREQRGTPPLVSTHRREREKYEKVWTFDRYRDFSPGLEAAKRLQLVRHLHDHQVRSVLDAGCGSGKLMRWLMTDHAEDFAVHGFDISANCLDSWFDDLKHEVLTVGCLWDAADFAVHYDAIICTDVLEHIPTKHIPAVLANFRRCANNLCFLSIALFADQFGPELIQEPLHLTVNPPQWWLQQLTDADLKVLWTKQDSDAHGVAQWLHVLLTP